jgi:hypothetical protein
MFGVGVNRHVAGRLSPHWPDGEGRRVPDDLIICKGTALLRFAHFPTINSVLFNAAELRMQSDHIVGDAMENRPPMTTRDVASEIPNLNEGCEPTQGGTPRTPPARGPAVA